MIAALALAGSVAVAAPCSTRDTVLTVYLEADPVAARDSIVHVRLCLGGASQSARVRSFSARMRVDTAFGRIADVEHLTSPEVYARADTNGGAVLVAGASSSGIANGSLITVRVRLARLGTLPRLSIVLTELSDAQGMSLVTRTSVIGLDAKCSGSDPALFEVLPPAASADPGAVLDLRIAGCGFSADRNTVKFGDVTVRNIKSTDDGTRIRVVIPKEAHGGGEVPPMQMSAGEYDVTVNNGRGTSNAKRVTLR
jgi:hypothetical protein